MFYLKLQNKIDYFLYQYIHINYLIFTMDTNNRRIILCNLRLLVSKQYATAGYGSVWTPRSQALLQRFRGEG